MKIAKNLFRSLLILTGFIHRTSEDAYFKTVYISRLTVMWMPHYWWSCKTESKILSWQLNNLIHRYLEIFSNVKKIFFQDVIELENHWLKVDKFLTF